MTRNMQETKIVVFPCDISHLKMSCSSGYIFEWKWSSWWRLAVKVARKFFCFEPKWSATRPSCRYRLQRPASSSYQNPRQNSEASRRLVPSAKSWLAWLNSALRRGRYHGPHFSQDFPFRQGRRVVGSKNSSGRAASWESRPNCSCNFLWVCFVS